MTFCFAFRSLICIFAAMKRLGFVLMAALPLVLSLLLGGCGDNRRATAFLSRADSLMAGRPDSALLLLDSCEAEVAAWPESQQMRFHLLHAKAQNKAYVPFTSDSVMTVVSGYYDRHGTSNEQVEAHYLLGCVYRDLGEAPKALSAYHDAVECADTTAADCDYALLARLHAQMSSLLHRMQLPYEALDEADKASEMSSMANDSMMMLDSKILKADAYYLLGKTDSVISISELVSHKYLQYGDTMYSILFLKPAIVGYLDKKMADSVKIVMDTYEQLLEDKPNEIIAYSKNNFNIIKAQYYLLCHQYDLASYYYQQARLKAVTSKEKLNVYRGLSNYYISIGKADSALKYTDLYVLTDDSVYRTSVRENFAKMHSLYNYEHHQRKAEKAEHQLLELHYRFVIAAFVTIILIALFLLYVKRRRAKMLKEYQELNTKYVASLNQYALNKKETELLKEAKESDELLIHQLQCEKAIDADTISKLTRKVERKKEKIRQNEDDLRKQAKAIAEFQKDKKRPDQWNMEEGLFNLPLFSHLHASISRGRQPSDSQLDEIIELTNSMLPTFIPRIQELYPTINHTNLLFCVFTKLRFINSERAVIFNMTYQSVTNRCAFLYKKFTGKKGGAGDFEAEIQKMG